MNRKQKRAFACYLPFTNPEARFKFIYYVEFSKLRKMLRDFNEKYKNLRRKK